MIGCERFAELLPELAVDVAPARERALALQHAESCSACQALLAHVTVTADAVLLAVPSNSADLVAVRQRTLSAAGGTPGLRSRLRPRRIVAAAAAVVILVAAAVGVIATHHHHTRSLPESATLLDADGHPVGRAVVTGGQMSSVFISFSVDDSLRHDYVVHASIRRGGTIALGVAQASAGSCTYSRLLPVSGATLTSVQLNTAAGQQLYSASFTSTN